MRCTSDLCENWLSTLPLVSWSLITASYSRRREGFVLVFATIQIVWSGTNHSGQVECEMRIRSFQGKYTIFVILECDLLQKLFIPWGLSVQVDSKHCNVPKFLQFLLHDLSNVCNRLLSFNLKEQKLTVVSIDGNLGTGPERTQPSFVSMAVGPLLPLCSLPVTKRQ